MALIKTVPISLMNLELFKQNQLARTAVNSPVVWESKSSRHIMLTAKAAWAVKPFK